MPTSPLINNAAVYIYIPHIIIITNSNTIVLYYTDVYNIILVSTFFIIMRTEAQEWFALYIVLT